MQLIQRLALIVSLAVIGAAIGSFSAGFFLPRNAGLSGGATILMSGIAGLVLGAIVGLLTALYATPVLRTRLNIAALPAAVLILAVLAFTIWRSAGQLTDSESAYEGLATFRLDFEQITITDPNLATSIRVDTSSRAWQITLPDGRICTGNLRAKAQASVGAALIAMHDRSEHSETCKGLDGSPVQILKWSLADATGTMTEKRLELPPGCSETGPVVAPLVRALRMIPSIAETKTTCN